MPNHALLALAATLMMSAAAAAEPAAKSSGKQKPIEAGTVDAGGAYQLSAEEQAFDCKRLTGRMQVRILQLREMAPTAKTSDLSHGMKQAAEPVASLLLGKSSSFNADRDKRMADDRAMLTAYNKQLAAKGCKTYNLDAELGATPGTGSALPRPVAPAATTAPKPAAK